MPSRATPRATSARLFAALALLCWTGCRTAAPPPANLPVPTATAKPLSPALASATVTTLADTTAAPTAAPAPEPPPPPKKRGRPPKAKSIFE